jgi:hypothetical protein
MKKTRTSKSTRPRSAKSRVTMRAAQAKSSKVVSPKAKPASNRAERAAERREAIIEAAMD